eukprot:TRINITY_DN6194_c0_g3_i1.p1 TRINITY_DN6194_c0_g3~~TRINITY_DN6194_c0_g3_i1.p1  ORF type:complete len:154 (-),score=20.82 TRINITY_DN6194_c0_g3_i1:131-592(-)
MVNESSSDPASHAPLLPSYQHHPQQQHGSSPYSHSSSYQQPIPYSPMMAPGYQGMMNGNVMIITCSNHPNVSASAKCDDCNKALCLHCVCKYEIRTQRRSMFEGPVYASVCNECRTKRQSTRSAGQACMCITVLIFLVVFLIVGFGVGSRSMH